MKSTRNLDFEVANRFKDQLRWDGGIMAELNHDVADMFKDQLELDKDIIEELDDDTIEWATID